MGFHAVQPARMLSMSLAGTVATSCLSTTSFAFFGATPGPFLRGCLSFSSSSSEIYEGWAGIEAMRAEDREGGSGWSSFGFFVGGLLSTGRVLVDGVR